MQPYNTYFRKVCLVLFRQRRVLIIGVMLVLLQLAYGFLVNFKEFTTMEANSFCGMHYPSYLPFYWFDAVSSINLPFPAIFCQVAYKQYRQFGSDAWRRSTYDGIQTMCMVIVCNTMSCCSVG